MMAFITKYGWYLFGALAFIGLMISFAISMGASHKETLDFYESLNPTKEDDK